MPVKRRKQELPETLFYNLVGQIKNKDQDRDTISLFISFFKNSLSACNDFKINPKKSIITQTLVTTTFGNDLETVNSKNASEMCKIVFLNINNNDTRIEILTKAIEMLEEKLKQTQDTPQIQEQPKPQPNPSIPIAIGVASSQEPPQDTPTNPLQVQEQPNPSIPIAIGVASSQEQPIEPMTDNDCGDKVFDDIINEICALKTDKIQKYIEYYQGILTYPLEDAPHKNDLDSNIIDKITKYSQCTGDPESITQLYEDLVENLTDCLKTATASQQDQNKEENQKDATGESATALATAIAASQQTPKQEPPENPEEQNEESKDTTDPATALATAIAASQQTPNQEQKEQEEPEQPPQEEQKEESKDTTDSATALATAIAASQQTPKQEPPPEKPEEKPKDTTDPATALATAIAISQQTPKQEQDEPKDTTDSATALATAIAASQQTPKQEPPEKPEEDIVEKPKDATDPATALATAIAASQQTPKQEPPPEEKPKDTTDPATALATAIATSQQTPETPPEKPEEKPKDTTDPATALATAIAASQQTPPEKPKDATDSATALATAIAASQEVQENLTLYDIIFKKLLGNESLIHEGQNVEFIGKYMNMIDKTRFNYERPTFKKLYSKLYKTNGEISDSVFTDMGIQNKTTLTGIYKSFILTMIVSIWNRFKNEITFKTTNFINDPDITMFNTIVIANFYKGIENEIIAVVNNEPAYEGDF